MLTRQEILNTAYLGLRAQGKKSVSGNGDRCAYRGAGNTKCAIGMLIRDEDYNPSMDNMSSTGVDDLYRKKLLPFYLEEFIHEDGENMFFLESLQRAHDNWEESHDLSVLRDRFASVAADYDLEMPSDEA